jgi:hypothetical protein
MSFGGQTAGIVKRAGIARPPQDLTKETDLRQIATLCLLIVLAPLIAISIDCNDAKRNAMACDVLSEIRCPEFEAAVDNEAQRPR